MSEIRIRRSHIRKKTLIPFPVIGVLSLAFFVFLFFTYNIYLKLFSANVVLPEAGKKYYLYIPTGADFKTVVNLINDERIVKDIKSFIWVSKKMHYNDHVHPGRFLIKHGMSNYELVSMLRSNANVPVWLVLNKVRTPEELASVVDRYLEADSTEIVKLLYSPDFLKHWGITKYQILCCFIPNTYEFYWNTSAEEFLERMEKEYQKFWNENRLDKAKKLGLSPCEVSTLASLVQEETSKLDEMPVIAGVYLNRLRAGMKLQADPTLKFALNKWDLKRLLNVHKEVESPYNTYKYKGLPPGPIGLPQIAAIDAVLNAQKHNYYYFCAKDDFSGYHHFSRNYAEHLIYARRYQRKLNELKIK